MNPDKGYFVTPTEQLPRKQQPEQWWRPATPGTSGAGLLPGEDDPRDLPLQEGECE